MRSIDQSMVAFALGVLMNAGSLVAQTSPCLTNPDTAAMHVQNVTQTVTHGDSARLAQQGIPYKPAGGVALVTYSLVCRSIVNAYNALSTPDSTDIARAYVMSVGPSVYAMAGEKSQSVYDFFDSAYHWLAGL